MRSYLCIFALLTLLLPAGVTGAANGNHREFTLSLTVDQMSTRATVPSQGERHFLYHFSPGRSGVQATGEKPLVDLRTVWPSIEGGGHTRDPHLIVLLSVRLLPVADDRVEVENRMTRWVLTGKDGYRMESETRTQSMAPGDTWHFAIGTEPDGTGHLLALVLEPPTGIDRRDKRDMAKYPVEFRYEMRYTASDRDPVFQHREVIDLMPDNDDQESVRFEAPARIRGADSSALYMSLWLDDASATPAEILATFNMDRMLVTNIVADNTPPEETTVNNGVIVMSDFQRKIVLRPNKVIRLELPAQENEDLPEGLSERIELRLLSSTAPQ